VFTELCCGFWHQKEDDGEALQSCTRHLDSQLESQSMSLALAGDNEAYLKAW